jgi:hypothetical protein
MNSEISLCLRLLADYSETTFVYDEGKKRRKRKNETDKKDRKKKGVMYPNLPNNSSPPFKLEM